MRQFGLAGLALLLSAPLLVAQNPTVVRTSGPGAWGARVNVVRDLRIGELEGEDAYTFGFILALAVGNDGAIFVGEGRPVRLRMYDANGKFVRIVGGEGDGPGEYRQIDGLRTMPDGGIALRDGRLGRITLYDAKGTFRTSHRQPATFFTADMFAVDRTGNFYLKTQQQSPGESSVSLEPALVYVRLNPAGELLDTIPIPRGNTSPVNLYGGPGVGRVSPLLAALSPDGYFVTGSPLRYVIDVKRAGQPVRIERKTPPVSLLRAERAEWDAWAEYLSKQPTSQIHRTGRDGKPEVIDGPTAKYESPNVKPAFRGLSVDEDGRIWVHRYVEATQTPPRPATPGNPMPPTTWREPPTYDLFEPDGRFLGTIALPMNFRPVVSRGRQIWGIERGDFDVLYVVRYRINQ